MKLLLCRRCQDVIRLKDIMRSCECGAVSGKYVDELNAVYSGVYAAPIGFANQSLVDAVENRPVGEGPGKVFTAFVIPVNCPTLKYFDTKEEAEQFKNKQ